MTSNREGSQRKQDHSCSGQSMVCSSSALYTLKKGNCSKVRRYDRSARMIENIDLANSCFKLCCSLSRERHNWETLIVGVQEFSTHLKLIK